QRSKVHIPQNSVGTMHRILIVSVALVLGLSVGCQTTLVERSTSANNYRGRLAAASKISDTSRKNAAIAKVARLAAEAGHGDIARDAIAKISYSAVRNDAAADVAVVLARAGQSVEALQVAELIRDIATRNRTLERIATQ
ncbi:MAG: hypothetical protein AAF517_09345, partial [Planctomycetota bacterium]